MEMQSWGLVKSRPAKIWTPRDQSAGLALAREAWSFEGGWALRGAGRSYADSALPGAGAGLMSASGMDHVVSFDRESGVLEAEAGATLGAIQELALRSGWGLPVLPGTAAATLGGALANDVHGKNHEVAGSFSRCVRSVRMARSDRGVFELDRTDSGLWAATVGGLGATGLMLSMTLQLERWEGPWIALSQRRFEGIGEFMRMSAAPAGPYEVAWVDAFARVPRGVLFTGSKPAAGDPEPRRRGASWPLPPMKVIGAAAAKAFNHAYWLTHQDGAASKAHWRPFFCPLDNIGGWNKLYGPAGFSQFQAVAPLASAQDALEAMFEACRGAGLGSFLAVLKRFGPLPSEGALSFAREGVTFAMDFPNQAGSEVLMRRLVAIALEAGGSVYPAKTALEPMEFRRAYPQWERWREHWDGRGPTRSGWIGRAMG